MNKLTAIIAASAIIYSIGASHAASKERMPYLPNIWKVDEGPILDGTIIGMDYRNFDTIRNIWDSSAAYYRDCDMDGKPDGRPFAIYRSKTGLLYLDKDEDGYVDEKIKGSDLDKKRTPLSDAPPCPK